MKKRIIEYVSTMDVGGIESFVKDICLATNKEKFDVMLISVLGRKGTPNEKMLDGADINIHYLYDEIGMIGNGRSKIRLFLKDRKCSVHLIKVIRSFNPDVLHVHGNELRIAKIVHFIPWKTKVFIHVHSEPQKVIIALDRIPAIKKILRHRNGQLIALEKKFAEEVNEIFGINDTLVLPNCVDLERFKDGKTNRVETRRRIGIDENAFVIGHVGIFRAVKNHEFLVKVFEEVAKRNDKAFLLMIGEGELEDSIRRLLSDKGMDRKYMILNGREDVSDLLGAMDVYVMPSKYEGFPVSLIEAEAVGLKCVVSDAITADAFVTDKIVPMGLEKSAAEWAVSITDNVPKYKNMNNLHYVEKRHVVQQLEDFYTEGVLAMNYPGRCLLKKYGLAKVALIKIQTFRNKILMRKYKFDPWHITSFYQKDYAVDIVNQLNSFLSSYKESIVVECGCGLGDLIGGGTG